MPMRLLGGTIMAIIAAACASLGVYLFRFYWRFRTKGIHTVGMVVDIEMKSGSNGVKWYPKVEFETLEGQKIAFSASPVNSPKLKGRSVKVIYMPDNPSEAEIPSVDQWIASFFILLFAAGLLGVSALFYLGFVKS
jgi:hypothetical protein